MQRGRAETPLSQNQSTFAGLSCSQSSELLDALDPTVTIHTISNCAEPRSKGFILKVDPSGRNFRIGYFRPLGDQDGRGNFPSSQNCSSCVTLVRRRINHVPPLPVAMDCRGGYLVKDPDDPRLRLSDARADADTAKVP